MKRLGASEGRNLQGSGGRAFYLFIYFVFFLSFVFFVVVVVVVVVAISWAAPTAYGGSQARG